MVHTLLIVMKRAASHELEGVGVRATAIIFDRQDSRRFKMLCPAAEALELREFSRVLYLGRRGDKDLANTPRCSIEGIHDHLATVLESESRRSTMQAKSFIKLDITIIFFVLFLAHFRLSLVGRHDWFFFVIQTSRTINIGLNVTSR